MSSHADLPGGTNSRVLEFLPTAKPQRVLSDAEFNDLVEEFVDEDSGEVRVLVRGEFDRDADTAHASSGRGRTGDLKRDVTIPGGHRAMLHLHGDKYGRMYVRLSETETVLVRDEQVIGLLKGLRDRKRLRPGQTLFLDICYATWGGAGSVAQRLAKATGLTVEGSDGLIWTFPPNNHPSSLKMYASSFYLDDEGRPRAAWPPDGTLATITPTSAGQPISLRVEQAVALPAGSDTEPPTSGDAPLRDLERHSGGEFGLPAPATEPTEAEPTATERYVAAYQAAFAAACDAAITAAQESDPKLDAQQARESLDEWGPKLSADRLAALVDEFAGLVGDGYVVEYLPQVFGNGEVVGAPTAVHEALLEQDVRATGSLVSLVNDLLMSVALTPVWAGQAGWYAVETISPATLVKVLTGIAEDCARRGGLPKADADAGRRSL